MAPLNAETLMVKTYYGDGLLHLPFCYGKKYYLPSSSLTGSTVILTPYDYFSYKVF